VTRRREERVKNIFRFIQFFNRGLYGGARRKNELQEEIVEFHL